MSKVIIAGEIIVKCDNKNILSALYDALKPDIEEEKISGVKRELKKHDNNLIIYLSSSHDKISKFRGVYTSIIRIINVITQLIDKIER